MPTFSPELIQTMRVVLEEAMTKVPQEQATSAIKANLAEIILRAAAEGQTTYDSLLAAAADQLQTILSMFT
jgi:N-acetylglucosamine kinase-like BadF-type ATPase